MLVQLLPVMLAGCARCDKGIRERHKGKGWLRVTAAIRKGLKPKGLKDDIWCSSAYLEAGAALQNAPRCNLVQRSTIRVWCSSSEYLYQVQSGGYRSARGRGRAILRHVACIMRYLPQMAWRTLWLRTAGRGHKGRYNFRGSHPSSSPTIASS